MIVEISVWELTKQQLESINHNLPVTRAVSLNFQKKRAQDHTMILQHAASKVDRLCWY